MTASTDTNAGPTARGGQRADHYLTVPEVAALLRVDAFTVRRWIGRGELPAFLVGRTYRVERDAVDAFLAARRVVPPQE